MTLNAIYKFLTGFRSTPAIKAKPETTAPQAATDEKVRTVVSKQAPGWEVFLQSPLDTFLVVCEHLTFKDITTLSSVSRGTRSFIGNNLEGIWRYFGPQVAKVKKVPFIEAEGYFGSLKKYCEFIDIINIIKSEKPLPDDIRKIVDDPHSFSLDNLKHLQEFCKAKDVHTVWFELSLCISNFQSKPQNVDFSSSKSIIETATEFSRWFNDNREALSKVRTLNLSKRNLLTLPPEIGYLPNLEALDLGSNKLRTLPPEISRLSKLEVLLLKKNRLRVLPPECGHLSNLRKLSLGDNRLSSLPSKIVRLSNLQELDLSKNKFQNFPKEICSLFNLEELNFSDNQLKKLPPTIGQLPKLCRLSLNNNQFQTVPLGICKLPELIQLDLKGNQLQTVPRELANLPKLKFLNL